MKRVQGTPEGGPKAIGKPQKGGYVEGPANKSKAIEALLCNCRENDLLACLEAVFVAIIKFIDVVRWEFVLAINSDTTQQLAAFNHLLAKEVKSENTEVGQLKRYIELLYDFLGEAERVAKENDIPLGSNLGDEDYQKEMHVKVVESLLNDEVFEKLNKLKAEDKEKALRQLHESLKMLSRSPGVKEDDALTEDIDNYLMLAQGRN